MAVNATQRRDVEPHGGEQDGRQELLGLGLAAVRVASAARRAAMGGQLDEADQRDLDGAVRALQQAADAIEYGLPHSGPGSTAVRLASVGLALDAMGTTQPTVSHERTAVDSESPAAGLRALARAVETLSKKNDPAAAEAVCQFFTILGRLAAQEVSRSGEYVIIA